MTRRPRSVGVITVVFVVLAVLNFVSAARGEHEAALFVALGVSQLALAVYDLWTRAQQQLIVTLQAAAQHRVWAPRGDRGEGLPVLLFAVAVAVLAALALMSFAQGIAREAEQRIPTCVVPTSSGCPDGPQP